MFVILFSLISCESVNQTSSKVREITQKTTKIIDLGPKFQLVTTYQNKQIDLFIKDFGDFDLTRKDGELNFQRLDRSLDGKFLKTGTSIL